MRTPNHDFVVTALMIMKFGTDMKLGVFLMEKPLGVKVILDRKQCHC